MVIVHIEDYFQPDAGYQVNLLSKLQVQQGHKVFVITSELKKSPGYLKEFFGSGNSLERDNDFYNRTGVNVIRIPLIGSYSNRAIYKYKIFRVVKELCPDVIFAHGMDTLISIQFIIRSLWNKTPLVTDCHMVEMASGNKFNFLFRFIYKKFITPILIIKKIPVIRVVDSDYCEKHLGFPLSSTSLLSFGTDVEIFAPNQENKTLIRSSLGIEPDDFVVLYAGKLDKFKGGMFLANSILEDLSPRNNKKITFLIIGNTLGEYGVEVDLIFSKSSNKICRIPTQPYHKLHLYYQAADIAVFPKQCSLSFFDVQASGLPVVLEDNEINIQRVNQNNGFIFSKNNIDEFRLRILDLAEMEPKKLLEMKVASRNYVVKNYNYVTIAEKYTQVLLNEINVKRDFQRK